MAAIISRALPGMLCLAAAVAALMLGTPAPAAGPVAALFPPWWPAADVFVAAGSAGRIVRLGLASFIVIVASEDGRVTERLRAAGAVMVFDPIALGGCAPVPASI